MTKHEDKSHELFARKLLKSSVAAMTQLFPKIKVDQFFFSLKCRQKAVYRYISKLWGNVSSVIPWAQVPEETSELFFGAVLR